ncbi:hypothetical protein PQ469_24365 [Mucilaginibacter sp. KACC 22773]|uniref:hypothetical protein n=1 Tax=Mucilaginibacter sp. KACC 22773 TaxID=3025671 RepID=UPI0023663015|nr:hypothetical protein [Mucilaginibacter sp. KACC 22773]WDF77022.1 hypothetical protein PQ469_24365 [Mucilaginibacter sp. KACC 22773]
MAHQLDFIAKKHIHAAIAKIEEDGVPNSHLWNEYWLQSAGKPYPFKYLVQLASEFAGEKLHPDDFKSNDSSRNFISSLGFTIRFIVQDVPYDHPGFWVGASYFGKYGDQVNMLDDFVREKYWATDHDLTTGEGLVIYKKLQKVKVNDRIGIRYLARKQNTVDIVKVGTVKSIDNISTGQLSVVWDYNPFLYSGPKPSGQGAGDWWKTLIKVTRPEDIELLFGYAKTQARASRLTWNSNGWVMPSGPDGKSADDSAHERRYGYGHEEWLFDTGKLIDGYHYGFLEPVRKYQAAYIGKKYDIWLYSINDTTKLRYWIGEIAGLEVIDTNIANEITDHYRAQGWLGEMENQIIASGANIKGFSEYQGIDLFNIRFKPENLKLNDPYYELPEDHPVYRAQRYTLMFVREEYLIVTPDQDDDFPFIPPEENEDTEVDRRRKRTYVSPPRPIEIVYLHEEICKALAKKLRKKYGRKNVKREHWAGYGMYRIDIVVKDGDEKIFYEIKSYTNLLTSIREAVGQLMEYALWPDRKKAKKMIVVTQTEVTTKAATYFKNLRDNYNLEVYYQSFNLQTNTLSEEI